MAKAQRFVVGMDGSAGARAALLWAAEQASENEEHSIVAVAAWRRESPPSGGPATGKPKDKLKEMLATEIAKIPDERVRTSVTTAVVEGSPADVLVEASEEADVLVLGRHGHGKAWHMVVGWTSEECARKVNCPVVIVPPGKK